MKYFSFLLIILFCFSCSKSLEEKCFIQENENYFNDFEIEEPWSIDKIIKNKPDYLQIINLKKFRSFKKTVRITVKVLKLIGLMKNI